MNCIYWWRYNAYPRENMVLCLTNDNDNYELDLD